MIRHPSIFNHPQRFIEGWYWVLLSRQLKQGQTKAVTILGRDLLVYRNHFGKVVILDAYCPHMGAHLAEGSVEGSGIRCFFHNWKFNSEGICVESPCQETPLRARVNSWPTVEKYGMIWIWTGKTPQHPLPFVPELEEVECDAVAGSHFIKNCHPNVLMINAIDAHHFNTVHQLPLQIDFQTEVLPNTAITFSNTTRGGDQSWFVKLIRPLYQEAVTYSMCYWYGSTGTVTVGPDAFHFHIMFTLRLIAEGKTEGQTLLLTPKRSGILGWAFNRAVLWLTEQVGNYFAKGDTQVFQTIRFNLQTPTQADRSIIHFIRHVERQKALQFGSWQPIHEPAQPPEEPLEMSIHSN
jgi:phenylpropionate dioxygenase-like ring-hydroxylating dioxygenase large terminal subunit